MSEEKKTPMSEEVSTPKQEVPVTEPTAEKDKEKKKKPRPIVIGAVALAAGIVLGVGAFFLKRSLSQNEDALERSVVAQLGQLDGKSEAEIEEELNRVIEDGYMNISINTNPVFEDGTSEGSLQIENSPANKYTQEVVIVIDETEEEIYRSGLLEPNFHIQNDKLSVDLNAGDYECTATFTAYDTETNTVAGSANAKITVTVLN